jgi:2',3'-cyclic-nucleotide 2'-phosphodiesterase (5'-nucleotidase family)
MKIDESIAQDISTQKVVNKWLAIENDLILKDSIRRNEIIATLKNPLDVRETLIRNKPSPIARLIAQSLSFSAPLADAAIFNTGSLRLDDVLNNNITQYDVLRLLPFGGRVVEAEMKGDLLENILNIGHTENLGTGGYLQHDNISLQQMQWTVKGKPIDKEQYYRIALPEFLLTGEEQNLKFLTKTHPSIRKIIEPTPESPNRNIQLTVIAFLKAKKWQE